MAAPVAPEILHPAQGRAALRIARTALEAWILRGESYRGPTDTGMDEIRAPAFVSLYLQGQLRGCVGILDPLEPLETTLAECAVAAASRDPRFPPLTPAELPAVRLEVSVLTLLVETSRFDEIVVGRDGLVVERAGKKGLLLPQVAAQQGWSREKFLDQACLKAGLGAGAWKEEARVSVFRAQVFAEPEPVEDVP